MPVDNFKQTLWQFHANPCSRCIPRILSSRLLWCQFHLKMLTLTTIWVSLCEKEKNLIKLVFEGFLFRLSLLDNIAELCKCRHLEFSDWIRVEWTGSRFMSYAYGTGRPWFSDELTSLTCTTVERQTEYKALRDLIA